MTIPTSEFDQYRAEILAALDDRDPVVVMSETLDEVERLTRGVEATRLARSPAKGEWSPWQVLAHLADNEMVWGVRVRMVATQDRPQLVSYDQDAWTNRFGGLEPDANATLERWEALRRSNLRLYASLTPDEWERVGLHPERGVISIRTIAQLVGGHDVVHLDQFRRGLAAG